MLLRILKDQFCDRKISIVLGWGKPRPVKKIHIGNVANEYRNRIYLTDDNPRYENPKKLEIK